ncbi:MAG: CoA transferase, partial [Acidimicrobiales bacterium]
MGPLEGVTVIEVQSIGPGPFCGMMLADMGATVIRVDRVSAVQPNPDTPPPQDVLARSRSSIAIDLKHRQGPEVLLELVLHADILIEGFRPGVAERLGIGPQDCWKVNAGLVYGRMTGWGQEGPAAGTAGHDINYIARTGALHAVGPAGGRPVVPLN